MIWSAYSKEQLKFIGVVSVMVQCHNIPFEEQSQSAHGELVESIVRHINNHIFFVKILHLYLIFVGLFTARPIRRAQGERIGHIVLLDQRNHMYLVAMKISVKIVHFLSQFNLYGLCRDGCGDRYHDE